MDETVMPLAASKPIFIKTADVTTIIDGDSESEEDVESDNGAPYDM